MGHKQQASWWALTAASVRVAAPSLARMFDTWTLAVLGEMTRAAAISLFDCPAATRRRTSSSLRGEARLVGVTAGCPPGG